MTLKRIFLILVVLVLCLGGIAKSGIYQTKVVLSDSVKGGIRPQAKRLVKEVNKKLLGKLGPKYTLYVANFEKGASFPKVTTSHNILWLGSTRNYIPDLSDFEYVFASTPMLRDFITDAYSREAYYLPLFTHEFEIKEKHGEFIALIGNPPYVEDILKEQSLPYRKYSPKRADLIEQDMDKFQAAFVENTALNDESIDLNPVFFTLAAQKVPLITHWGWPQVEETINLFNDEINFYMDSSDAQYLIQAVLAPTLTDEINERLSDARRLVKNEYSLKQNAQRIAHVLQYKKELVTVPADNSLNIDLPVFVGHIISGDFWLAQDLSSFFRKNSWNTSLTFFNSFYGYKTKANIWIQGSFTCGLDRVGDINIYYLAYPRLDDGVTQEVAENEEVFYKKISKCLTSYDAIATASQSLAKAFTLQGIKTHYIPQFTNEKRFYPNYVEKLKSDVLFVGQNAPYRRAAKIALENNLPITIYGPRWGDVAKGDYVDNRVLRQYYSSAKIVLNDSLREMLAHGVISNRIFDATACGTLVISDYMPEIEEIYGDSIPMWKTEEELIALIKYYLDPAHEEERLEKAKRAQEITLQNFTAEKVAKQFEEIINEVKKTK